MLTFCSSETVRFIVDSGLPEPLVDSDEDSAHETGDESDREMDVLSTDAHTPDTATVGAVNITAAVNEDVCICS